MGSIEERLERLERAEARRRIFSYLKLAVYAFLIVGVGLYLYGLYATSGEWKAEVSGAPSAEYRVPYTLDLKVPVRIYNPDGLVTAKMVYYRVYIEGEFAGDGFIPYLNLEPGWSEHKLPVEIDLSRVSCGIAKALSQDRPVELTVRGVTMVDLRVFGKFTWKTVTVPFNYTVENYTLPTIGDPARTLLRFYAATCDNPQLLNLLVQIAQQANSTGFNTSLPGLPGLPVPGGGGSGEANASTWGFKAWFELTRLYVRVYNNGSGPLNVTAVYVNGINILEAPATLGPSQSITLNTPSTRPAHVRVVTDKGVQEETVW